MTTTLELARTNMVDNQVRTWDVLDPRVLDVLARVRREDFVPERFRAMAFVDTELPLGHGEVMLKPVIEGRILQALAIEGQGRNADARGYYQQVRLLAPDNAAIAA
jgi:protein-L-isoaspartate(D-aspartate) O-methyltransferase